MFVMFFMVTAFIVMFLMVSTFFTIVSGFVLLSVITMMAMMMVMMMFVTFVAFATVFFMMSGVVLVAAAFAAFGMRFRFRRHHIHLTSRYF